MSFYIACLFLIIVIPAVIGIAYLANRAANKRKNVRGRLPRNGEPVTLDRNPQMPKMPGATS